MVQGVRSVARSSIEKALSPAQIRRMEAAERRRAEAAAAAEPVVVNGRALTRSQRDRLAQAETLAAGGLSERRKAASIVRSVEAELAAARTLSAVDEGIADTLARAEVRGESYETEIVDIGEWRRTEDGGLARRDGLPILDVKAVRRASRTDGLARLYRAGSITDEEKRTGDSFRALCEAARPPVRAGDMEPSRGGVVDREGPMASAMLRGYAAVMLSDIAREIGDGRTFVVLDAVAGRGASIRSLGESGPQRTANLARLKAALAGAKRAMSDPKWQELAAQRGEARPLNRRGIANRGN